jgi:hypothetical protein
MARGLYEALGEDVTNELVNWFNSVDATYRADLRELNESNFARFDAKLEQRLTTLRADLDTKWMERWTALDAKVAEVRSDFRAEIAQVRTQMSQIETKLADRLGQVKSDLLKWMLTFWVSTLIGLGALFFRG